MTDNDGLVSRDTCTVEIIEQSETPTSTDGSSSSGSSLGAITEIASPPVIVGIVLLVFIIGGVGYYMMTRDNQTPYVLPPKPEPVSGSGFMESVVPEVSPVKERKVVERKIVTDTMTIECPECSARMDVPNVSGMQQVQCGECGLEGEIEL